MEEIVYEPSLPFVVQVGVTEYSAVSAELVRVGWGFHSAYDSYSLARYKADDIARTHEHVRVVKVT